MKILILFAAVLLRAAASSITVSTADTLEVTQTGSGVIEATESHTRSFLIHWSTIAPPDPDQPEIDPSILFIILGGTGTYSPNDNDENVVVHTRVGVTVLRDGSPFVSTTFMPTFVGGEMLTPAFKYGGSDTVLTITDSLFVHIALFTGLPVPPPPSFTAFSQFEPIRFASLFPETTFTVTAIPEPSTWLPASLALRVAGAARRKQRHSRLPR
ncbi:MAG: hypothetical protein WDO18_08450 [Acidobacteriota bacterium]